MIHLPPAFYFSFFISMMHLFTAVHFKYCSGAAHHLGFYAGFRARTTTREVSAAKPLWTLLPPRHNRSNSSIFGSALNSAWGKDGLELNAHSIPTLPLAVVSGEEKEYLFTVAGISGLGEMEKGIHAIALPCGNCFFHFPDFI
ncbi:MAG: hypothetical protein JW863_04790 [Chitinispirillaceae bacterium]|nr:hypothetical protein [Chitinispirillaceae bacterium]